MITDECPDIGTHEYRVQDGYVICAKHGRWLRKVDEWRI